MSSNRSFKEVGVKETPEFSSEKEQKVVTRTFFRLDSVPGVEAAHFRMAKAWSVTQFYRIQKNRT